jgi:hypothetical protein
VRPVRREALLRLAGDTDLEGLPVGQRSVDALHAG